MKVSPLNVVSRYTGASSINRWRMLNKFDVQRAKALEQHLKSLWWRLRKFIIVSLKITVNVMLVSLLFLTRFVKSIMASLVVQQSVVPTAQSTKTRTAASYIVCRLFRFGDVSVTCQSKPRGRAFIFSEFQEMKWRWVNLQGCSNGLRWVGGCTRE